jgi:CubicO group peptidase (beta-lactamase class C family)
MRSLVHAAIVLAVLAGVAVSGSAPAQEPSAPEAATTPVPTPAAAGAPQPDEGSPVAESGAAAETPRPPRRAIPPAPLAAGPQIAPPIAPAELEAFVDGVVTPAMQRQHITGVTVSVVQNGRVTLQKGYGFASLAPARRVDPERSLFRLGAVSQTFTWIGVMRAAEAGRLRLTQPVNLYLPPRAQVRDEGFDRSPRVIDLMAHAGGFDDRALGKLYERDPDYVRPLELYLAKDRPQRVRPPGVFASYSSYDAALAGGALAEVSGKTFERLMEEDIFLPLGMGHTTFRERRAGKAGLPAPMPDTLAGDVAEGYRWTAAGFRPSGYEYIGQAAPAGSASSTAADMARYMLALLGDGRTPAATLYGPATAAAFRSPILPRPPGINGWAHGFMVETLPGGRTGYGHTGETLAFSANMLTVPSLGLGVFVAANTASGRDLVQALPGLLTQAFYGPDPGPPPPPSPALAGRPALFAGHYLPTRRAYSGLEGFVDRLTGGAEVRVTRAGRLTLRDMGGVRVWAAQGDPRLGRFASLEDDEALVFWIDRGRAEAFETRDGLQRYERIPFWRSAKALRITAGAAAVAAAASLIGALRRSRRELRETPVQSRGGLVQNLQAGLWLGAIALFGLWHLRAGDIARLTFDWPGPLLVTASACALVASVLTFATLAALPAIWRGGRRVNSWPIPRRLAYSVTVLVYAAFAVLLFLAGALAPWRA